MLPKKYHAIIFVSILVMLLLLGLHLLGLGFNGSQAAAKTAALARNSTQQASSSSTINQQQAYMHPIVYDKLTGATNNQISEVLGAKQPTSNYPIDHYQQQQQQQQSSQQQQPQHQFDQLPQDDFFANMHRQQAPAGFPAGLSHPLSRHMHPPMGPPMVQMPPIMTTQSPQLLGRQPAQLALALPPLPPQPATNQRQSNGAVEFGQSPAQTTDSLPSASSLTNNGATQPVNLSLNSQLDSNNPLNQAYQQQAQQPIYYTPPIFAYNNFDQNRPMGDPQPYGFLGPQQQQQQQAQLPPLGVPEAPMSIEEYNARQTRLRQLNQQLNGANMGDIVAPTTQGDTFGTNQRLGEPQFASNGQQNLLADPQQQQRHKQQMLDRQLLFGNAQFAPPELSNQSSYYPDPALYRSQTNIRPPYAHSMGAPGQPEMDAQFGMKQQSAQNRILPLNSRLDPSLQQQPPVAASALPSKLPAPQDRQLQKNGGPSTLNQLMASSPQQLQASSTPTVPLCARQSEPMARNLEMVNSSSQMPTLFCSHDPEYPIKEIMRALELYAAERSIEQLLPQPLVQIHSNQRTEPNAGLTTVQQQQQRPNAIQLGDIQRQLTLDSLQPSIGAFKQPTQATDPTGQVAVAAFDEQRTQPLFPSANYESLCRSTVYMAQPRRAKSLLGQWKIVVNLPGHKYRGIAISQMVRVEECQRPNAECTAPVPTGRGQQTNQTSWMSRSRCLQHYENQRLVAWSHQQGLHVDIFRVPVACSCHIRR